jgi:hypothetical protein
MRGKNEILWFLEVSAYCAVNCYALISGYVNSKPKYSSLALIWLQVAFYTLLITAGFAVVRPESVGFIQIVKSIFPATSGSYWYFSSYFCMFLFLPILSTVSEVLSKKQFGTMLAVMTIFFSVISLTSGGDAMDLNTGYSAIWLAYLYLFGAYIKKYEPFKKITQFKAIIGYILCVLVTWGFILFADTVLAGTPLEVYCGVLLTYTSPTILGAGFFLFILFKQINVSSKALKKIIGLFSAVSFSVYIIHSHPLIYEHLLKLRFVSVVDNSLPIVILTTFGIVFGIYVCCSIIDIPRHLLFSALKLKKRLAAIEAKLTSKNEG